ATASAPSPALDSPTDGSPDLPRAPRRAHRLPGPRGRLGALPALPRRLDTLPESVRQIDDPGLARRRGLHHLAALQLGLDQLGQRLTIVVVILRRIERLPQQLDQG